MYYRVASQEGQWPTWQWKSSVLSSLESLFHFLRLYRALLADQLRVFSSPSREGLDEQLICENNGLGSNSVTATQFLHERMLSSQGTTPEVSRSETQEQQKPASIGTITNRLLNESSIGAHAVEGMLLVALGLSWHWDLKGSGLSPFRYRSLIAHTFETYGFFECLMDEPNVSLDPANILLVRIGQQVKQEVVAQLFQRMRFF